MDFPPISEGRITLFPSHFTRGNSPHFRRFPLSVNIPEPINPILEIHEAAIFFDFPGSECIANSIPEWTEWGSGNDSVSVDTDQTILLTDWHCSFVNHRTTPGSHPTCPFDLMPPWSAFRSPPSRSLRDSTIKAGHCHFQRFLCGISLCFHIKPFVVHFADPFERLKSVVVINPGFYEFSVRVVYYPLCFGVPIPSIHFNWMSYRSFGITLKQWQWNSEDRGTEVS